MGFCVPASTTGQNIPGLQYFRLLGPLFAHLHAVGTARDRAGNRQLFYDQYATLLLLYFFNPTVTSLRGLQQMTTFAQMQAQCGIRRTSLGALSEAAASVFDAAFARLLHSRKGLGIGGIQATRMPKTAGALAVAVDVVDDVIGALIVSRDAADIGQVIQI